MREQVTHPTDPLAEPPLRVVDVAVVGAGPAGMAAAVAAAEAGAGVVLLDAGGQLGGQYWRHPAEAGPDPHGGRGCERGGHGSGPDEHEHGSDEPEPDGPEPDGHGHHGWATFLDLRARIGAAARTGTLEHRPWTSVWLAERDGDLFRLRTTPVPEAPPPHPSPRGDVLARRLVLAPGAYDRQLPVPGWDLPGVVTAGGAQALLKGSGVLVGRRVVVAGTGPFLLPVAAGLADGGAHVVALCEAADPRRWARHAGTALRQGTKLAEAAGYAVRLARHRVRPRTRTVVTEILGTDRVTGARLARVDAAGAVTGPATAVAADSVALGWGFTPQLELPLMLGAATAIGADGSLVVRVDPAQRASVPGLYVAGEATGVGGAALAVAEGHVAGRAAAGAPPDPARRREVLNHRAFARAMHAVYPVPAAWPAWPAGETLVCRCEEVSAATLRTACHDLGADDPRAARSLARVGMGRCQGRVCGWAAASLLAAETGRDLTDDDLLASSRRPLAAHVPLGTLAGLDTAADQEGSTP
ncbi:NAD(P)/FAD-dependent oxidoreductase [Georgenia sp. TF02-10]|uniref:FAD/NAD(P)-dependent oxidoreductase n=1 Tax=Georgenia sp. TF02-10 TaxID=2917725 RepID=UPI001FA7B09D|nr:NAD(P)/FAD-dependent oxidoreductase [Georgenia sp. TF02-10]UNX55099.1 NAD(P)/FAD-dependent oxidoreductase [Georgenia sp. TF02-10]